MKKLLSLLFATTVLGGFVACNDNDSDYPSTYSFVTEHLIGANPSDYYFVHDNGESLYPGDKKRLPGYQAQEGRRAIIYYNLLKTAQAGYDHNISLYAVEHSIRTGVSTVVASEEELLALGSAPTSFNVQTFTTPLYFNICLGYIGSRADQHRFTLVRKNYADAQTADDDEFLRLELRHDDNDDNRGTECWEWLSFPIAPFAAELAGKRGTIVEIETRGNGLREALFLLPEA